MSLKEYNKRQVRVELAKRTSANTWGDWIDITDYFVERLGSISVSIDDEFQGNVSQASVNLKFNNTTGKFNIDGTEGSLWSGNNEFMYHSRIRYWEILENKELLVENTVPSTLPTLDGLISVMPKYTPTGNFATLIVNSKLDILRDHFIMTQELGRVYRLGSTSIIQKVISLYNTTYAELGVITYSGLFLKEVIYDDVSVYSSTLLDLVYKIISDGGGIGGLRRDNKLFFSYFEAEEVLSTQFSNTTDTEANWHFLEGTGATSADSSGAGLTLNIDTWVDDGFFNYAVQRFNRTVSGDFSSGLTDYTLDILLKIPINRPVVKDLVTPLVYPIFMWCEGAIDTGFYGASDYQLLKFIASGQYAEGFCINQDNQLVYTVIHNTGSDPYPNPVASAYVVDTQEVLCDLIGEDYIQLLTISVDDTNNLISVYLNGKFQNRIVNSLVGTVSANPARRTRILGQGYAYTYRYFSASPIWIVPLGSLCKIEISNMRLRNTYITNDADAYTLYEQTFGNEFNMETSVTTHIVDNFEKDNLEGIVSTSITTPKNIVILEESTTDYGFNYVSVTSAVSARNFTIGKGTTFTSIGTFNTNSELVLLINSSTVMQQYGIKTILNYNSDWEGVVYPESVLFYSDGTNNYTDFQLFFSMPGYLFPPTLGVEALYNSQGVYGALYATFMPYGDSQFIKATDVASQEQYGVHLLSVANYKLLKSPTDKLDSLVNVLEKNNKIKTECIIRVPFNMDIDILDIIVLRLSYADVGKFKSFKEGSLYLSWSDSGTYRFKNFYVVSIDEPIEGNLKTVKLIEKLED